jgi:hypothetical protein
MCLYEEIEARLMGLSIPGLRPGKPLPEPLAEGRRFEGIPGLWKVGIEVFCVSEGGKDMPSFVRRMPAIERRAGLR